MADKETVTPEKKQKTTSNDFSWKNFGINLAVRFGEGLAYAAAGVLVTYVLSARRPESGLESDNVVAFNNKRSVNS